MLLRNKRLHRESGSERSSIRAGLAFIRRRHEKVDSPLFEIALVLVPREHVASIRDNGQRVDLRYTPVSKCDMAKPTQAAVSQVNLVGIGLANFPRLFWGEHPPFTPVGVGGGNF